MKKVMSVQPILSAAHHVMEKRNVLDTNLERDGIDV